MKSILFNTESVKAILDGLKSVTRRVVKPQPTWDETMWRVGNNGCGWGKSIKTIRFDRDHTMSGLKIPFCSGDILYVQETWYQTPNGMYWYKADNICQGRTELEDCIPKGTPYHKTCDLCEYLDGRENINWRPSIHMPKEVARLFLRVMDVRVERLQGITPEQLRAEGVEIFLLPSECQSMLNRFGAVRDFDDKKKEFAGLWNSAIKKADLPLYGWDANPWVWVIEFNRISKDEALANA